MTKTMREEIKPPKYLGEAIAKLPEIIELKRKLAVLADDFYMNHSFDTDWLDAYVEAIYLDCFKPLFDSQLQSYADEVREKVIEDCLHDFHGAIDISNIVDYDEAKQALSTLNKRYGITLPIKSLKQHGSK